MGESNEKPKVISTADWKVLPDKLAPGPEIGTMANVEDVWTLCMYFIPPGIQTTVFSMEDKDDGAADEYKGPCHEFYYTLVGELTMFWGENVTMVREGKANKLPLKPGNLCLCPKGWKYSVKNTGKVPSTLFRGLTSPPKGTKTRPVYPASTT